MTFRFRLLFPALILVLAPLTASAQDAATVADVRCVAVGIRSATRPDSHQKSAGLLMALYYIGRLDGRDPNLDLEALLRTQIARMNDAEFTSESARCGNALTAKGAQITHLGQALQSELAAH